MAVELGKGPSMEMRVSVVSLGTVRLRVGASIGVQSPRQVHGEGHG